MSGRVAPRRAVVPLAAQIRPGDELSVEPTQEDGLAGLHVRIYSARPPSYGREKRFRVHVPDQAQVVEMVFSWHTFSDRELPAPPEFDVKCGRCGMGIDDDGDGDCGVCAGLSGAGGRALGGSS